MGRGQYQPVSDGSINKERSAEQLEQARIAIELAQDIAKLQSMLKSEGLVTLILVKLYLPLDSELVLHLMIPLRM